ncbi:MAG: transcription termination factor Rho [Defluviitaleaceae bacterium]|nr:transcription termination factor Rho [Defluviitaleaceae bacterium]
MDYEKMSLVKLKELAKELGLKNVSRTAKGDLVALITEHEKKIIPLKEERTEDTPKKRGRPKKTVDDTKEIAKKRAGRPKKTEAPPEETPADLPEIKIITDHYPLSPDTTSISPPINETINEIEPPPIESLEPKSEESPEIEVTSSPPPQQEPKTAEGILEILPDGYGFLRADNFLPGSGDTYIAPAQIRRFNLRTGDLVCGIIRQAGTDKFNAISYIQHVNGDPPYTATRRPHFEYLTPIFPTARITLETSGQSSRHMLAPRIIDLLSPVGFGQRGMIVSPPKAGKTVLLKQIANAITHNHPDVHLIVLLIDERPEEVTDMERSILGKHCTVVSSTFDEQPENHKRLAEMVLERAKRLVEQKKDLVILMDSITRLGRAYNLTIPAGGRTLSGGLDPAALYMPKKFFGAARNIEEGGSLTVLATALVDTGSKMDDVIFEEFKGTGNMELVLDRRMAERRVFPAIDIMKSGTRRDDLLLSSRELDAMYTLREMSGKISTADFSEQVADMMLKTDDNKDFVNGFMEVRKY